MAVKMTRRDKPIRAGLLQKRISLHGTGRAQLVLFFSKPDIARLSPRISCWYVRRTAKVQERLQLSSLNHFTCVGTSGSCVSRRGARCFRDTGRPRPSAATRISHSRVPAPAGCDPESGRIEIRVVLVQKRPALSLCSQVVVQRILLPRPPWARVLRALLCRSWFRGPRLSHHAWLIHGKIIAGDFLPYNPAWLHSAQSPRHAVRCRSGLGHGSWRLIRRLQRI
uniref:Uncharacterized protein n=1 Tax=Mycena chlorophos TaxID=658473 RepID=A0ABQ0LN84_MYCCL|nr:predicted protein [Mycena chlorophos]